MKKYIIKPAKGGELPVYFKNKEFYTVKEASDDIIYFAKKYDLNIFDFTLDEIDVFEPVSSEIIKNFDDARKYLRLGEVKISKVVAKQITELAENINPANVEALSALNKLFTIAEAWNKYDGFVPDFGNVNQEKYSPYFIYNRATCSFEYMDVRVTTTILHDFPRLCFKSRERAAQFGRRFADLYNSVFLPYCLYSQE